MAAKFNRQIQVSFPPDQLQGYVASSLDYLRWNWWQPTPLVFKANASASLASWGENILIDLSQPGWLFVESECAFPLQLVDWGKNRKNVNRVLDQLSSVTGVFFQ